jgi:uncharacterized RDD family membrane protein YckC
MKTVRRLYLTVILTLGLPWLGAPVFMAAGQETAKGIDRGKLVSIGHDVELKAEDTAGEVVVIGGSAIIRGHVDNNVVVVGGDAEVDGEVGGKCVVVFGDAHFGPKAVVRGDTVTVGGANVVANGATIEGRTQEVGVGIGLPGFLRLSWLKSWIVHCVFKLRPLSLEVGWVWWMAGAFLMVYLLIALLFPHPVRCCVDQLSARPATSFAVGILVKLMLPVVCLLLPFTIIGVFLVPFVVVAGFLALLVGKTAVLEHLGGRLGGAIGFKDGPAPLVAFLIGAVLLTACYLVPVLGLITLVVASLWGLGAVATAVWVGLRRENAAAAASVPPPVPAAVPVGPPSGSVAAMSFSPPGAGAAAPEPGVTPPQALACPRAGFWARMGAGFLDIALMSLSMALLGPLSMFVAIAYFAGMWAWKGTTVGGIVLNLQVVREDGQPLNFLVAFVRSLAAVFSILILFLGFFWIGWDRQKQGWHDKIAGTVVVRLPKPISLVCL